MACVNLPLAGNLPFGRGAGLSEFITSSIPFLVCYPGTMWRGQLNRTTRLEPRPRESNGQATLRGSKTLPPNPDTPYLAQYHQF